MNISQILHLNSSNNNKCSSVNSNSSQASDKCNNNTPKAPVSSTPSKHDDKHREKTARPSYNPSKGPFIPLPIPGFISSDNFTHLSDSEALRINLHRSPSPLSPIPASLASTPLAHEPPHSRLSLFNYLPNHVSKRFSKRAQSDPWIAEKLRYSFNRRYTLGTDSYFLAEVIA